MRFLVRTVIDELELRIRARHAVLYLVSPDEERALAVLAELSARLDKKLYAWTHTRGMGPARAPRWDGSLADPLVALEHAIGSDERALYALLDFHAFLHSPVAVRKVRDAAAALEGSAKSVVLVSPVLVLPPELARDVTVLELPPPDERELGALLDEYARRAKGAGRGLPVALAGAERETLLRAARGLTRKEFAGAVALAAVARGALDASAIAVVKREKEQALRRSGALAAVDAGEGLEAVGGLDALKRWLELRASAFTERARAFGLPPPKGLFLVGVQGAGKSLCAKSAAAAWGLPLLRMDVGAVFSSAVGSSEANVRQAIALAEGAAPCVLWVDEIDKAFAGTEGSAASDAGTAARVFGTFLSWLQDKRSPVFVIATANAVDALPPELLRKGRFDEIFFVDLPGPAERVEILAIHLTRRGRDARAFDLESLAEASEGCAGAELEQAVIAGLFHAFESERELETRDVLRALRETVPLSRTMGEKVEALRRWAHSRARPASAAPGAAARRVLV